MTMTTNQINLKYNPSVGFLDEFLRELKILAEALPRDTLFHIIFVLTKEGGMTQTEIMESMLREVEPYYHYVGSYIEQKSKKEEEIFRQTQMKGGRPLDNGPSSFGN